MLHNKSIFGTPIFQKGIVEDRAVGTEHENTMSCDIEMREAKVENESYAVISVIQDSCSVDSLIGNYTLEPPVIISQRKCQWFPLNYHTLRCKSRRDQHARESSKEFDVISQPGFRLSHLATRYGPLDLVQGNMKKTEIWALRPSLSWSIHSSFTHTAS
ncbi:hypothetical protein ABKN59_009011 [Abortiporus biennis]